MKKKSNNNEIHKTWTFEGNEQISGWNGSLKIKMWKICTFNNNVTLHTHKKKIGPRKKPSICGSM